MDLRQRDNIRLVRFSSRIFGHPFHLVSSLKDYSSRVVLKVTGPITVYHISFVAFFKMKSVYSIALMRGDGIGPEIIAATLKVLDSVSSKQHFRLEYREVQAGDGALKEFGDALPKESLDAFAECDACLKGPVGETVMDINLKLRFGFDLYANIRPCRSYPGISPPALRPDIDLVVLRENSEGFYKALENEITPGTWTASGVFTEKGANRIANSRLTMQGGEAGRRRVDALK
jgi:3-isopropylmalate dehydrogenase